MAALELLVAFDNIGSQIIVRFGQTQLIDKNAVSLLKVLPTGDLLVETQVNHDKSGSLVKLLVAVYKD